MAVCEYRITSEEASKQKGPVIIFLGPGYKDKLMCQIAMNNPADFDGFLACGYPEASTKSCPVAQEAQQSQIQVLKKPTAE